MNANELADEFKEENNDWNEDNLRHWGKQTEAMLRQQQAEIEALKNGKIRAYNNGVEDGRKPDTNNKPVAWISVLGVDLIGQKFTDVRVSLTKTDVASIPLYTHQYERPHNTVLVPCDKLAEMQAEIKDLKAKLQLHEAMDNQCASLMQQFRKAQEK